MEYHIKRNELIKIGNTVISDYNNFNSEDKASHLEILETSILKLEDLLKEIENLKETYTGELEIQNQLQKDIESFWGLKKNFLVIAGKQEREELVIEANQIVIESNRYASNSKICFEDAVLKIGKLLEKNKKLIDKYSNFQEIKNFLEKDHSDYIILKNALELKLIKSKVNIDREEVYSNLEKIVSKCNNTNEVNVIENAINFIETLLIKTLETNNDYSAHIDIKNDYEKDYSDFLNLKKNLEHKLARVKINELFSIGNLIIVNYKKQNNSLELFDQTLEKISELLIKMKKFKEESQSDREIQNEIQLIYNEFENMKENIQQNRNNYKKNQSIDFLNKSIGKLNKVIKEREKIIESCNNKNETPDELLQKFEILLEDLDKINKECLEFQAANPPTNAEEIQKNLIEILEALAYEKKSIRDSQNNYKKTLKYNQSIEFINKSIAKSNKVVEEREKIIAEYNDENKNPNEVLKKIENLLGDLDQINQEYLEFQAANANEDEILKHLKNSLEKLEALKVNFRVDMFCFEIIIYEQQFRQNLNMLQKIEQILDLSKLMIKGNKLLEEMLPHQQAFLKIIKKNDLLQDMFQIASSNFSLLLSYKKEKIASQMASEDEIFDDVKESKQSDNELNKERDMKKLRHIIKQVFEEEIINLQKFGFDKVLIIEALIISNYNIAEAILCLDQEKEKLINYGLAYLESDGETCNYEEDISKLCKMGYSWDEAFDALEKTQGTFSKALEYLLNRPTKQLDLKQRLPLSELERRISLFTIDHDKLKKTDAQIFNEIIGELKLMNGDKDLGDLIDKVYNIYFLFKTFQMNFSEIFYEKKNIINEWDKSDFKNLHKRLKHIRFLDNDRQMAEVLAIISKAVTLFKGGDFYPKITQIIAVIIMALSKEKGILCQINTGEGKSLIVAMLAILRRLQGYKVDIISSSIVLAERDTEAFRGLFMMFDFKATTCKNMADARKEKIENYRSIFCNDIIFGDIFNFQCVLMEKYWYKESIDNFEFGNRFNIVDEVDSMMIDQMGHMSQLASPTVGDDHLNLFLILMWKRISNLDLCLVEHEGKTYYAVDAKTYCFDNLSKDGIAKADLENFCQTLLERNEIFPSYLKKLISINYTDWIESAINAAFYMHEEKDYIISDKNEIVPVDNSTGVLQEKTSWSNALHQFLQIKHSKKVTSITTTHAFVSNVSFFKNYASRINGMTGTLGSVSNIHNLKEIYGLETYIFPPYKKKQFIRMSDLVCRENLWASSIVERALDSAKNKGQAVLVINSTIGEANLIYKILTENGHEQIYLYSRNDDEKQTCLLQNKLQSGDIVVATNLAGRGADFLLSENVLLNGGLFVIMTFLPVNKRIEDQGFGRAGRNGQPGSGILILNGENINSIKVPFEMINENPSSNEDLMNQILLKRDEIEVKRNEKILNKDLIFILTKDKFFRDFCNFNSLEVLKQNKAANIHLICEVEDRWGKFIQAINQKFYNHGETPFNLEDYYENFVLELKEEISRKSFVSNPYFYIERANEIVSEGNYKKAISKYKKAQNLFEGVISAYYNEAYAVLLSETNDKGLKTASDLIKIAIQQIENVLIPNLTLCLTLMPEKEDSASDYTKHYNRLINMHIVKREFLEDTLKKIESLIGTKGFKVYSKSYSTIFSKYKEESGFLDFLHKGFFVVFDLERPPPEAKGIDCFVLGVLTGAQLIGGVILSINVGAPIIGIQMICDAVKDGCKLNRVYAEGENHSWSEYFNEKIINYSSLVLTSNSSALLTNADSIFEATNEVVSIVDEKLGEKLKAFHTEVRKYRPLAEYITGNIGNLKDGINLKKLAKGVISESLHSVIERSKQYLLDEALSKTIGDKVESFIKGQIKDAVEEIFSEDKKLISFCFNVYKLKKSCNLKQKIENFKTKICDLKKYIENFDEQSQNVPAKQILPQIELFEKIVFIIQNLKFLENFNVVIDKYVKYVKGEETDCSEMKDIFAKIPMSEKIAGLIRSNLKNIKYFNRIKGLVSGFKKVREILIQVKEFKLALEKIFKSIDFSCLENLVNGSNKEFLNAVGELKIIFDLIQFFLPQKDDDDSGEMDKIIEEISQSCKNEIIRNLSNIINDKASVLDKKIIEKLVDKFI